MAKKVIFCCPTVTRPYAPFLAALEASIPLIQAAGWDEGAVYEVGNPYISHARASMLRKALDAQADVIVFLDHDLSWEPEDLLTLIETNGDVVAGTYRFKRDDVEYMGQLLPKLDGTPQVREDGALKGYCVPAGFLKITPDAVDKFMRGYPNLCYGKRYALRVDLFNHGARDGVWFGEDYSFSKNWVDLGGEIWVVPNLNITHHTYDNAYPGNFHEFLLRQPGGSKHEDTRHGTDLDAA